MTSGSQNKNPRLLDQSELKSPNYGYMSHSHKFSLPNLTKKNMLPHVKYKKASAVGIDVDDPYNFDSHSRRERSDSARHKDAKSLRAKNRDKYNKRRKPKNQSMMFEARHKQNISVFKEKSALSRSSRQNKYYTTATNSPLRQKEVGEAEKESTVTIAKTRRSQNRNSVGSTSNLSENQRSHQDVLHLINKSTDQMKVAKNESSLKE